jgi:hypothetical protein
MQQNIKLWINDEAWPWQCSWIMDIGSGERGALDKLDGLSDKQGDLTSIESRTTIYKKCFDNPSVGSSQFLI